MPSFIRLSITGFLPVDTIVILPTLLASLMALQIPEIPPEEMKRALISG